MSELERLPGVTDDDIRMLSYFDAVLSDDRTCYKFTYDDKLKVALYPPDLFGYKATVSDAYGQFNSDGYGMSASKAVYAASQQFQNDTSYVLEASSVSEDLEIDMDDEDWLDKDEEAEEEDE